MIKDNFFSVKLFLEKSIEQLHCDEEFLEEINIVKEARYLLDSLGGLYCPSTIDENDLPFIPGNAVVLVPSDNSNNYHAYFVENSLWIKERTKLKSVSIRNLYFQKIRCDDQNGLAQKSEQNLTEIARITRKAQLKRGRASISMKYYALKRKRKQLEQDLEKKVSFARNIKARNYKENLPIRKIPVAFINI